MGRMCGFLWVLVVLPVGVMGQAGDRQVLQQLLESIVERVAESGSEAAVEGVIEHFERLYSNPLDINSASVEELERLQILSMFQVESLLEYRKSTGNILSAAELELVNGYTPQVVAMLRPFIFLGEGTGSTTKGNARGGISKLLFKGWWEDTPDNEKYIGPPYYTQLKYRWELPGKIQTGFLLEKDAGEKVCGKGMLPFGDFSSFHLNMKNIRLGKGIKISDIILGDYTVRCGQGLAVWNAFSLGRGDAPSAAYKSNAGVLPYTSSDENRFFRGAALALKKEYGGFREAGATLFISRKNVDARVEEGKYTSLPKDGLHNTQSLAQTRKRLGELVYGGSLSIRNPKFKGALNYIGYGYNAHNGRRVTEKNRYQMYDGQYGNVSADMAAVLGRFRCFAEMGVDYGGAVALLCGAVTKVGGWELSGILRNYPKDYIAPYAGAYSSTSSCSNQRGISLNGYSRIGKVGISLGAEAELHKYKVWGRLEGAGNGANWNARFYTKYEPQDKSLKLGIKGIYGVKVCRWLQLKARGECVCLTPASSAQVGWPASEYGVAAGADAVVLISGGKAKVVTRGVWYNTTHWDTRLYIYENDLPSTYVSTLLHGCGIKWYALVTFDIGKSCTVYVKGDGEPKIKLGLEMRFF